MQDYCWDSLASLYTFRGNKALLDLARDYLSLRLPRIHPVFHPALLREAPKIQGSALPLSYRGKFIQLY